MVLRVQALCFAAYDEYKIMWVTYYFSSEVLNTDLYFITVYAMKVGII